MPPHLRLRLTPWRLAVARLDPGSAVPAGVAGAPFCAVVRTPEELTVVLPEDRLPAAWRARPGWACLAVAGPLDFDEVGVLAALAAPLAAAGVSLFAVSSFDTDYLLVPAARLAAAIEALRAAGHRLQDAAP